MESRSRGTCPTDHQHCTTNNHYCTTEADCCASLDQPACSTERSVPAFPSRIAKAKLSGKVTRNVPLVAALAQEIRLQRHARQITQDELAKATGLDRSYIISIEKGKRNISITKLAQIAAVLGLSASQLVSLAEQALVDGL